MHVTSCSTPTSRHELILLKRFLIQGGVLTACFPKPEPQQCVSTLRSFSVIDTGICTLEISRHLLLYTAFTRCEVLSDLDDIPAAAAVVPVQC